VRKIAIVGTAPSTRALAPFGDPAWEIWGLNEAHGDVPQWDRWFDLHDLRPYRDPESPYHAHYHWLARQANPVYVREPDPAIKAGVVYPKERIVARFGPYFFTSTVAWMMALAIDERADAIGVFGVDMAAGDEYADQKAGCRHFIQAARDSGIEVVIPAGSDLLLPPRLYGFDDPSPWEAKMAARRREYGDRIAKCREAAQGLEREVAFLEGALADIAYLERNWK
jgi:hypothetical protein